MTRSAVFSLLIGAGALLVPGQPPATSLPPIDYSLGADAQPQANVRAGTVSKHVLAPGKYFPGTPHNYQVYVPAGADEGRPDLGLRPKGGCGAGPR